MRMHRNKWTHYNYFRAQLENIFKRNSQRLLLQTAELSLAYHITFEIRLRPNKVKLTIFRTQFLRLEKKTNQEREGAKKQNISHVGWLIFDSRKYIKNQLST